MRHNVIKTAILALLLSFVTSCKESEKDTEIKTIEDKSLHIKIEAIVPKNDSFQIYWTEDGSDNFTPEKYINLDIKGSDKPQLLDFKIPEESLARQLRFDLGSNKEHVQIKLVSFKLKYMDKEFNCPIGEFWKYFGNNTSIEYDKNSAVAKLITNLPEGFDPIFGGTPNITIELDKLYMNK